MTRFHQQNTPFVLAFEVRLRESASILFNMQPILIII